jgi:hypothetical protein
LYINIIKFIFQTDDLRLILDWGENPKDLENELVAFDANGKKICRVTYEWADPAKNLSCVDSGLKMSLDVDNTGVNRIKYCNWVKRACS